MFLAVHYLPVVDSLLVERQVPRHFRLVMVTILLLSNVFCFSGISVRPVFV